MGNEVADFADGEWHDWNGGNCPVPAAWVEYKMTCMPDRSRTFAAIGVRWEHIGRDDDIISFRVINAPEAQPND